MGGIRKMNLLDTIKQKNDCMLFCEILNIFRIIKRIDIFAILIYVEWFTLRMLTIACLKSRIIKISFFNAHLHFKGSGLISF